MRIIREENLTSFEFWSGAKDNADLLTYQELEQVEQALEGIKEEYTETEINDLFWFDFSYICELAGLEFDEENFEVIR